jgi:hypothetical protein
VFYFNPQLSQTAQFSFEMLSGIAFLPSQKYVSLLARSKWAMFDFLGLGKGAPERTVVLFLGLFRDCCLTICGVLNLSNTKSVP